MLQSSLQGSAFYEALLSTRLRASPRLRSLQGYDTSRGYGLHEATGFTRLHCLQASTLYKAMRLSKAPLSMRLQFLQDLMLYEAPLSTRQRGSTRPLLQGCYAKVPTPRSAPLRGPLLRGAYAKVYSKVCFAQGPLLRGAYSKVPTLKCLLQGYLLWGAHSEVLALRLLTPNYLLQGVHSEVKNL